MEAINYLKYLSLLKAINYLRYQFYYYTSLKEQLSSEVIRPKAIKVGWIHYQITSIQAQHA